MCSIGRYAGEFIFLHNVAVDSPDLHDASGAARLPLRLESAIIPRMRRIPATLVLLGTLAPFGSAIALAQAPAVQTLPYAAVHDPESPAGTSNASSNAATPGASVPTSRVSSSTI